MTGERMDEFSSIDDDVAANNVCGTGARLTD